MTSYIGPLVRREVPITCDDWRKRELKPIKGKIWSDIHVPYVMSFVFVDDYVFKLLMHSMHVFFLRYFNIDDDWKTYCLQLSVKRIRGFRSFFTKKFLRDDDNNFIDAELLKAYAGLISPEELETFKEKRRTSDFQDVTVVNRQRASSPTYPYRKGRMGYACLQQRFASIYKCYDILVHHMLQFILLFLLMCS